MGEAPGFVSRPPGPTSTVKGDWRNFSDDPELLAMKPCLTMLVRTPLWMYKKGATSIRDMIEPQNDFQRSLMSGATKLLSMMMLPTKAGFLTGSNQQVKAMEEAGMPPEKMAEEIKPSSPSTATSSAPRPASTAR